ncbi:hypothetical protein ZYGR_0N06830 [Zygosaccharomyces rouxii]|uniref:ZYRO0D15972p n=2 Tax=Zygosaccharomyces rouxii TaxID=4956 RepID=C5DWM2_ZYGRC|nr:uncharacterized protein ZYRO0D15972g [Zygosaccharomyces rouxii]KAH9201102.1 magnesium transporter [Zygosaccharomyces rouxii]GAV49276.1 hypothetical protein ZYGR_0N06830 [Zygosaccharomyces rouxii]CAR28191.1 ZYRO0D15972p [Zygosaccharomyces rouxii]
MALLSTILILFSSALILHSGFSSHEFHQLLKSLPQDSHSYLGHQLPKDIQYEAIAGIITFTIAVFFSFKKLTYYPLQGPQKLITLNHYLHEIRMNKATNVDNLIGNDPYGEINHTPNFIDIHAKREETKRWLEQNDKKEI